MSDEITRLFWNFDQFDTSTTDDSQLPYHILEQQQNEFNGLAPYREYINLIREQTVLTNDKTDYGEVVPNVNDSLVISLKIYAPKLKNYRVSFVTLKQSVTKPYPCYLNYHLDNSDFQKCNEYEKFAEMLTGFFQHPNTLKLMKSLYDQSIMITKVIK